MGSYAYLYIEDLPLTSFKTNVAPEAMALFRPGDLRITDEIDSDGEKWRRVRLAISGRVAIARLNAMGFTQIRALRDFEDARSWLLDEDAYYLPTDEDRAVLGRMTPDEWLISIAQLHNRRDDDDDVASLSPVARCLHVLSQIHLRFEVLPFPDPRSSVRLAIDHSSADVEISCDISDLVGSWRMNVDDPDEIASIFDPIEDKLLILTEGATDSWVIRSALAVVYPHLVDYVAFLDFESSNYGGGAPSLVNVVRAFAGASIPNRIVAVFDNDAAAADARRGLKDVKLPPNIRVVTLPDTPRTSRYPSLVPGGGTALSNLNGMAASIELYFGEDVLRQPNGGLMPIQWHGYNKHLARYQGELLDKHAVQKVFRQKVETCIADPSRYRPEDWIDMRAVLDEILNAK